MTREIRVHIDTLEYSRRGLATRKGIPVDVGAHNRVVLVRPQRARPLRGSGVGFAHGSAFPLPGTLLTLWQAKEVDAPFTYHGEQDEGWRRPVLQVYGHCGPDEGDAPKLLSERRARVVQALVTSDVESFRELGREDGWGDAEAQSMLRTLGCDPGPVDGRPERLTLEAARVFAHRYERGTFHSEDRPTTEALGSVESLDDVRAQLEEAFVLAHGLKLAPQAFHPHHPAHGCCAFNRPSPTSAHERRTSIVTYSGVPAHSENAPCRLGDEDACAVVDEHDMSCLWYREHVEESPRSGPHLFAPRWLWLGGDRYVLSCMTTADDGEPVTFDVVDADAPGYEPERLEGIVRGGVAAVVWASKHDAASTGGRPPHHATSRFSVRHPAHPDVVVQASWPELRDLELFHLSDDHEALRARTGGVRLVADDGSYEHFTLFAEAITRSARHVVLVFPGVPSNARIDGVLESGALEWTFLQGATVEEVEGACAAGEQCEELPPSPAAPSYQLAEDELDWTASVGVAQAEHPYE